MFETVLQPISAAVTTLENLKPNVLLNAKTSKESKTTSAMSVTTTETVDTKDELQPIQNTPNLPEFDPSATHIQSSPYADPVNQLDLRDLSPSTRLFALALTRFQSTRPDYATAPYMTSFNWPTIFSLLRTLCLQTNVKWERQEFYLVIFRSTLRKGADQMRLGELDQKSHEEACASGGLLHYWFGRSNAEMRNLATCVWRNREDAAAGGKGPWHRKARGVAREMYEQISFHTHKLVVEEGAMSWRLEEYHD